MPLFQKEKKLVVIPVYNEEATIASVIGEIRKYYGGDILVVDDGSTDRSIAILTAINDRGIHILNHSSNLGYGRSLIDAFNWAADRDYTALVTIDCDWQHEPKHIPEFFTELKNVDVVSGSRYYFDQKNNGIAPNDRYKINRLVTEEINRVTSYQITDSFCGFKGYKVAALKRLNLTESGYAMPLQFWIQACLNGLKIKEIPVSRIYNNLNRTFGGVLDDPEQRLKYYLDVIKKELESHDDKNHAHCCTS